jgi:hypothetical protein
MAVPDRVHATAGAPLPRVEDFGIRALSGTQRRDDRPQGATGEARSGVGEKVGGGACRMDLPGPTTSVGTWTDYSGGPWDYPACATRHLKAWSTRTTQE